MGLNELGHLYVVAGDTEGLQMIYSPFIIGAGVKSAMSCGNCSVFSRVPGLVPNRERVVTPEHLLSPVVTLQGGQVSKSAPTHLNNIKL